MNRLISHGKSLCTDCLTIDVKSTIVDVVILKTISQLCWESQKEAMSVRRPFYPNTPRLTAVLVSERSLVFLESPEEECVVGMARTVYWDVSRPVPFAQVPGDIGELLRHLEV